MYKAEEMTKVDILGFLINQHLNLSIMQRHMSDKFQDTYLHKPSPESLMEMSQHVVLS